MEMKQPHIPSLALKKMNEVSWKDRRPLGASPTRAASCKMGKDRGGTGSGQAQGEGRIRVAGSGDYGLETCVGVCACV